MNPTCFLSLTILLVFLCLGNASGVSAQDPARAGQDTARARMQQGAMQMRETVEMMALNNSGVTGQATVTSMGQQTQLMVQLNATGTGTHQGHIHTGTCASPGSVVQPLEPITTNATGSGSMTTTVGLDPMRVMDGQHIVVYHQAGGSPGQPVVCGNIPQHTMAAQMETPQDTTRVQRQMPAQQDTARMATPQQQMQPARVEEEPRVPMRVRKEP